MSLERAKQGQIDAGETIAAIGGIRIEPTDGTVNSVASLVEIAGLQMKALHSLCLSVAEVVIELNRLQAQAVVESDYSPADAGEESKPPTDES